MRRWSQDANPGLTPNPHSFHLSTTLPNLWKYLPKGSKQASSWFPGFKRGKFNMEHIWVMTRITPILGGTTQHEVGWTQLKKTQRGLLKLRVRRLQGRYWSEQGTQNKVQRSCMGMQVETETLRTPTSTVSPTKPGTQHTTPESRAGKYLGKPLAKSRESSLSLLFSY